MTMSCVTTFLTFHKILFWACSFNEFFENFRKAKKSGSNVFALFSQRQIQEFKEAFGIMDADKDGLLSSGDIVAAFNSVGKSVSDGEAQGMLSEAPGPVNFTQMVMLFAEKMAGGM